MNATVAKSILAVVVPVALVLGYRQFTLTQELQPAAHGSSTSWEGSVEPKAAPSRVEPKAASPHEAIKPTNKLNEQSIVPDRAAEFFHAFSHPIIPTSEADFLKGIPFVKVDVDINEAARSIPGFQGNLITAKVESRLRQARIPIQEHILACPLRLQIDLHWGTNKTSAIYYYELSVLRPVHVSIPSGQPQFLFSQSAVWSKNLYCSFVLLSPADSKAKIDSLLDGFVNDFLKVNPK
jgi:hypothetical protein